MYTRRCTSRHVHQDTEKCTQDKEIYRNRQHETDFKCLAWRARLDQLEEVQICILHTVRARREYGIRLRGNPFPRSGGYRGAANGWFKPGGLLRLEADLDKGSMRVAVIGENSGVGEAGAP